MTGKGLCQNIICLSCEVMNLFLKVKEFTKKFFFYIIEWLSPLLDRDLPVDKRRINKIMVIAGGGIGDLICSWQAIRCLSDNFPVASVSLLISPAAAGVLPLLPKINNISEIIDYDSKGIHKIFLRKIRLIHFLRRKKYDLIYSPSRGEGMREEIVMSYLIGSTYQLGFKKGKTGFLHTTKIELRDDVSLTIQNLDILKAANFHIRREKIRIEVMESDLKAAQVLLTEHHAADSYPLITVHVGSTWNAQYKCWPFENYITLIQRILKEFGAKVIIVGSKGEAELGEKIIKKVHGTAFINTIGKTTIGQMTALIKKSHLFIGNDSGPLHISSALGIPSIGIFGSTSPIQILSNPEQCLVVKKDLSCSPCYIHQANFKALCNSPECLTSISVSEVENAVRDILTRGVLHADRN